MCSELTPRARIPDTRIPQLMQPCHCSSPVFPTWSSRRRRKSADFGTFFNLMTFAFNDGDDIQASLKHKFIVQHWQPRVLDRLEKCYHLFLKTVANVETTDSVQSKYIMHSQKVSHRLGVPCLAGHERDCNQNQPRAYTRWKPDHHRGPEVLSIFSGAPNMLIILFITTISWDPVDSLRRCKKLLFMKVLIKAKPKWVLNQSYD